MPVSKTRKKPVMAPRSVRPPVSLEGATWRVLEASTLLVKESEMQVRTADTQGLPLDELLELHSDLCAATLGLLVAYNRMTGQPDPRGGRDG